MGSMRDRYEVRGMSGQGSINQQSEYRLESWKLDLVCTPTIFSSRTNEHNYNRYLLTSNRCTESIRQVFEICKGSVTTKKLRVLF